MESPQTNPEKVYYTCVNPAQGNRVQFFGIKEGFIDHDKGINERGKVTVSTYTASNVQIRSQLDPDNVFTADEVVEATGLGAVETLERLNLNDPATEDLAMTLGMISLDRSLAKL